MLSLVRKYVRASQVYCIRFTVLAISLGAGSARVPLSACPHARWLKGLSYCLTTKVSGVDYLPSK